MHETLGTWLRMRTIDAPRIENFRQFELLCETDTDRELWQCLAEGAALDVRGSLANVASDPWRNAIIALRWTREEYISRHSLSKGKEEPAYIEQEDALEAADQQLTDEINLYLSRLFGGKEFMDHVTNAPTIKSPKAKKPTTETDDELLARSLSYHGPFKAMQTNGATDDELLVEIRKRWRQAMVHGPRRYAVTVTDAVWGTAIWFDTTGQHGQPSLNCWEKDLPLRLQGKSPLLPAVRRVLEIPQKTETETTNHETNGHAEETDDRQFETLKAKGKSKAKEAPEVKAPVIECGHCGTDVVEALRSTRTGKPKRVPHPSTTSTTTPSGILANDPDACAPEPPLDLGDDERAVLGPIVRFPIAKMTRSPYQTRAEPTPVWLRELADSMESEGQLQPCLVRPSGELIGGHTRCEAGKLLKWTELDVRIVECDDATARRLVLIDNAKRQDLTERARVQAYAELLADYKARGRTQAEMAAKLKIDETTLSNILRLQSLPDALWERYEAKGLSVDQIRFLAVHAARPKFVTAFLNYLEKNCFCKKDEQPENGHFDSAFERGIESAFRPMTKDTYGRGCQFKPSEEEKKLLEIVDVKRRRYGGGVSKMAANVNLWNKLNQAAKKKAKEKETAKTSKAPDPKALKAAARVQAERQAAQRTRALEECWHSARGMAIAEKFAKPKRQDFPAAIRLRMFMIQVDHWRGGRVELDLLTSPEPEFIAAICADVHRWFEGDGHCDLETLELLVEWLQVDPVPFWQASKDLLDCCTADELQELAEDFDLPENQTANNLVEVLVEKWPAGHVPDLFVLTKPEPKKPTKKARAK